MLLAITVGACVKDSTVPESIHKQPQDFKFSDARAYFEENAKMPANSSTLLSSLPTKSTDDDTLSLLSHFTVLWDNVQGVEMPDSYVYEIPLLHNIPLSAALFAKSDSGFVHTVQDVNLQSNLIIRKFHKTGKIRMFISTAVGRNLLPDSLQTHTSPLFWTGNKTHFEGYEFYTALNGVQMHYAYRFECGHKKKVFLDRLDNSAETQKGGFIFAQADVHTKSGEDGYGLCNDCGEELTITGYCNRCGKYLEGALIIGEVDRCPGCGEIERLCRCAANAHCPICGDLVCSCYDPFCEHCGGIGCRGSCLNHGGSENPDEPPGGGEPSDNKVYFYITVKANTSLGGDANGGGRYPQDTTITLLAEERAGYDFGGWKGDGHFFTSKEIDITVTGTKTYMVYFYPEKSECAKLFRDYKNNDDLKNTIKLLDSKRMENPNIEYAYAKPQSHNDELFIGNETGVKVLLNSQRKYEYIIHNHPTGKLIPSAADIYKIYIETDKGTLPIGSSFLIVTDEGCLSIEVEDFYKLQTLAFNTLSTEKDQKDLDRYLYYFYIGKSTDLKTFDATKSVVSFYMDHGLKFKYAGIVDNTYNWNKVQKNGNDISIDDCIN